MYFLLWLKAIWFSHAGLSKKKLSLYAGSSAAEPLANSFL